MGHYSILYSPNCYQNPATGEELPSKYNMSSLRFLAAWEDHQSKHGDGITPSGQGCCPIVDTWWQTETVRLITLYLVQLLKPGSATLPFLGLNLSSPNQKKAKLLKEMSR